jgi:hypothetical protein
VQEVAAEPQPAMNAAKSAPPAPAMAPRPVAVATSAAPSAKDDKSDAQDPSTLEARAQQDRHSGNYRRAAALYRQAAALRRDADPSAAAWDLAHAVECLAAEGQFEEANKVRAELTGQFPSQNEPQVAARRALRELPASDAAKQ